MSSNIQPPVASFSAHTHFPPYKRFTNKRYRQGNKSLTTAYEIQYKSFISWSDAFHRLNDLRVTVIANATNRLVDYCDVAWSSIGKIERDKLDRAQRRAAKIVLKTKDSDAEKNLKWLPLSMRRDMHTINFTFKCFKGSPPIFFKDYFKVFRTVHNTRGSGHNLLLPKVRSETARKSFYFNGSKLFNNIASEMKDTKSVLIFKTRILELYRSKVF